MTAAVANPNCPLPDRTVALPVREFEISPAGKAEAERLRRLPADELFHHLVRDQESDAALLTCRLLIEAFLAERPTGDIAEVASLVELARSEFAPTITDLTTLPTRIRQLVC